MRTIKFRAWDTVRSEWYKPTHEAYKLNLFELMVGFGGDLLAHTVSGVEHESLWPDRFKLMQFTGLFDKSGKELYYSCDLVKLPEHEGLFIAVKDDFDVPCFCRQDDVTQDVIQFSDYFLQPTKRKNDFEIVGTTYENQELLKP